MNALSNNSVCTFRTDWSSKNSAIRVIVASEAKQKYYRDIVNVFLNGQIDA